jgi:hypothetical protein
MSKIAIAVLVVAVGVLGGCRSGDFGKPQLFGPGSAKAQRDRAQRFDPYPDTNIGPAVSGSRPDGYTAPAPEPARGHFNQWTAPTF